MDAFAAWAGYFFKFRFNFSIKIPKYVCVRTVIKQTKSLIAYKLANQAFSNWVM